MQLIEKLKISLFPTVISVFHVVCHTLITWVTFPIRERSVQLTSWPWGSFPCGSDAAKRRKKAGAVFQVWNVEEVAGLCSLTGDSRHCPKVIKMDDVPYSINFSGIRVDSLKWYFGDNMLSPGYLGALSSATFLWYFRSIIWLCHYFFMMIILLTSGSAMWVLSIL